MKTSVCLTQVSCVLPQLEAARIHAKVIYCNGEQSFLPVRPDTVLHWIAQRHCIDFKLARRCSEALNHLGKGAPLPLGVHDVFLPVHLVDELAQGYACYGYCNVANQVVDVHPVPGEKHQSLLRLSNGTELLTEFSPAKMSAYLSMAIATRQRFLQDAFGSDALPSFLRDSLLYLGVLAS